MLERRRRLEPKAPIHHQESSSNNEASAVSHEPPRSLIVEEDPSDQLRAQRLSSDSGVDVSRPRKTRAQRFKGVNE